MRGIFKIIQYEIKQLMSDHSLILVFLIAPVLYAFFLGAIYLHKDIEEVPIAVLDLDQSATSREIIRLLDGMQQIKISSHIADFQEGVEEIQKLKVQGFFMFPKDFEKSLRKMEGCDLALYLNTSQFLPSNNPNKDLQKLITTVNAGIRLKYFETKGVNKKNAMELVMPLSPDVRGIANPTNAYGDFLLPGLFILILHQTLLFGMGETLSKDREKKKLPYLLSLVNGHVSQYFIGKTAFYFVLYLSYFFLFLTTIFPIFELNINGNLLQILLLGFVMVFSTLMFGAFIGSFFKTQIGFLELIAFSSYPVFLLSGFSWPFQAMPLWTQYLGQLLPITPFISAFTRSMELGAEWHHISYQFVHLILLSILYGFLALMRWIKISETQIAE